MSLARAQIMLHRPHTIHELLLIQIEQQIDRPAIVLAND
jgi:hypothetical protein